MGNYLNPGNEKFAKAINSEIYVDKTGLLIFTNQILNTMQQNICVSRPRRFGKSTAANMLAAYYGKGCASRELFQGLNIVRDKSFEKYQNKYDVLTLLIHLGYLAYDVETKEVYIPNIEIRGEFINCVSASEWGEVSKALKTSADTLQAILQGKEERVAEDIAV